MKNEILNQIETKTCGRCGGSGRYSYCQMYGDTCFKCSGAGKVYTKRGVAARNFLNTIRSKPVSEVKVGDLILVQGFGGDGYFATVIRVGESKGMYKKGEAWIPYYEIETETPKRGRMVTNYIREENQLVRVGLTAEQKAETFKRAMEFQATLKPNGQPYKRTAAAPAAVAA